MDFSLDGIGRYLIVAGLCGLSGFLAGGHYVSLKYDRQIAEYQREAEAQRALLQDQLIRQERESAEQIRQIEQRGLDERRVVDARYRDAIAQLERLRENSTRSSADMPSSSSAPSRAIPACKCKPLREDAKYAGALAIARDCDILAIKYNQLLEIYKSLR